MYPKSTTEEERSVSWNQFRFKYLFVYCGVVRRNNRTKVLYAFTKKMFCHDCHFKKIVINLNLQSKVKYAFEGHQTYTKYFFYTCGNVRLRPYTYNVNLKMFWKVQKLKFCSAYNS